MRSQRGEAMSSLQHRQSLSTTLYVDDYQIDTLRNGSHTKANVWQEATALQAHAATLGGEVQSHALINRHSHQSLAAYSKTSYAMHVMNGDRPAELHKLVEQARLQGLPDRLLVASDDPIFRPLCLVAAQANVDVSIISPTNQPHPFLIEQGIAVCALDSVKAAHQPQRKTVACLDMENLLYTKARSCKGSRQQPNLKRIWRALDKCGEIDTIVAFGDFNKLAQHFRCDIGARLEKRNVVIEHTDNLNGKNSADMLIARHIQDIVEHDLALTTIVLASGDRDFRPVVELARAVGKEVILISQPNALSGHLAEQANRVIPLR